MRFRPLLNPSHLWFALSSAGLLLFDKLRGAAPLPLRVRDYVFEHAGAR